MSKAPVEIRSLARQHTEEAVNALLRIMRKSEATDSAVVAAAAYLLNRGWGTPPNVVQGDENGGPVTVTWLKS